MLSTVPFEVPAYLLKLCRNIPAVATAIAGADHTLALKSAREAANFNIITPILIGDRKKIEDEARAISWDLKNVPIINANNEEETAKAAVHLAKTNKVKAIMKGQLHTDTLIKAVLNKKDGLRIGLRLSHIFHMTVPNKKKVLMITDGAINVDPNLRTKIDIIINAIELAHALGNKNPNVAILSATETPIPSMPSSIEATEVLKSIKKYETKSANIYGPLAFDNAISPEAAKLKSLTHPVAGNADILIVPNIETGNSLFKMMVYFMSAVAAGVVMGAKVPIMLTSRGDPIEARIASAALAALTAQNSNSH